MPVLVEKRQRTLVVTIDRPEARNAVDRPTADALADAFRSFEADDGLDVAIVTGAGGHFCAGADLKAMTEDPARASRVEPDGDGPMNRRFGVPLMDGGNVRLPRVVGLGRALDMILTARAVDAAEAHAIGLVNRLCAPGHALGTAHELAATISSWPQGPLRGDRLAAIEGAALPLDQAMANEFARGVESLGADETLPGVRRFAKGEGRHGEGTS